MYIYCTLIVSFILFAGAKRHKARNFEKARVRQSQLAAKEAQREAEMMVRKEKEGENEGRGPYLRTDGHHT